MSKNTKLSIIFSFIARDDRLEVLIDDKSKAEETILNKFLKKIQYVESLVNRGKLSEENEIRKRIDKTISKFHLEKWVSIQIGQTDINVQVKDRPAAAKAALERILQVIEDVRSLVNCGKYGGQDEIGLRVRKVVNRYKVAKHFVLNIQDDEFEFHVDEKKVGEESQLDRLYVICTSLPQKKLSAEGTLG